MNRKEIRPFFTTKICICTTLGIYDILSEKTPGHTERFPGGKEKQHVPFMGKNFQR